MEFPVLARGLGIFAGPDTEVEAQLDQVNYFSGLWVGGGGSCGHNGLDDAQGGVGWLLNA